MNMQKKTAFIFLLTVVIAVGAVFLSHQQKSISGLVDHFNKRGLHAQVYNESQTDKEQKVVEDFRGLIEDAQQVSGSRSPLIIDTQVLLVDGIAFKVTQYKEEAEAKKVYMLLESLDKSGRERDEKQGLPHDQSEFFLNGQFLIRIDHYDVRIEDGTPGLTKTNLELDPATIVMIQTAFAKF
jgi:hypothetical protein